MFALDDDTVHLLFVTVPDEELPHDILSDAERARAERILHKPTRRAFIAMRSALRHSVASALDINPSFQLAIDPMHKPYLAEHPEIHFNLSHSESVGLLGLTRGVSIGVDVEDTTRRVDFEALIPRVARGPERARLEEAADEGHRRELFFRLWTRKEAVMKAIGVGLGIDPRELEVSLGEQAEVHVVPEEYAQRWVVHHVEPRAGVVGAVCYSGARRILTTS
ncbi:MAG: 4'-phosphopantetheinyl transferase superfamily protein [Myxococcota bacterium]